jgi:hypothetical protein
MGLKEDIEELRRLDVQAQALRTKLGFGQPDEVIWQADSGEDLLLVEADGYGGASVQEVEGNYPVDFTSKHERAYATEEEACGVARQLDEGDIDWDDIEKGGAGSGESEDDGDLEGDEEDEEQGDDEADESEPDA